MAKRYSFSVARLAAHPTRDERLNVGIVIFLTDRLDARPARNLDKLKAISASYEAEAVRAAITRLIELDAFAVADGEIDPTSRLDALRSMGIFELSDLGCFEAPTAVAYEQCVTAILARLVEPEPAAVRKVVRRSRLLSSLKFALKEERVLARKGEDLSAHRVVAGWQLAEGLSADLVLKNGAMHVIETVDAESDEVSIRRLVSDIAVSALVLEQARMTFGETETLGRLVYRASAANETLATPSLLAAEHQGAQLINWASADDRLRLITELSALAVPLEPKTRRKKPVGINASTQQKMVLN